MTQDKLNEIIDLTYTTEIIKPQVASINFMVPRNSDIHIYEEELKTTIQIKSIILAHYLERNNLVNLGEAKIETTILPEKVCIHKNCKNIVKYDDYKVALENCIKEHPEDIHLQLITIGKIWVLTVDKKYKFLKGQI